jgi:hypothetical protein
MRLYIDIASRFLRLEYACAYLIVSACTLCMHFAQPCIPQIQLDLVSILSWTFHPFSHMQSLPNIPAMIALLPNTNEAIKFTRKEGEAFFFKDFPV